MSEGRDDGPAPAVPIKDVPMEDVLKSDVSSTPPHPQVGHWQAPARKVFGPLLRGLWSAEVEGIENVPTDGPALIAPNHISFIDSMFVLALLPRRTLAVGKAEYMDSWKTKWFPAIGMGTVPVERHGGVADHDQIEPERMIQTLVPGEPRLESGPVVVEGGRRRRIDVGLG